MNVDKYNLITLYIKRASQDINRFRKFFTQSLENKPEHLKQWISYLSEANLLEAALALNDLANPTEELKEIVLKSTIDVPLNHSIILTLLYLNEHERIIEYLNNIDNKKVEDAGDDLQYAYEKYDSEFTEESFSKEESEPQESKAVVKIYESYMIPQSLGKDNRYVVKHLLDKSDYNLIIDYMLDISKSNVQNALYDIAKSIDKIVVNDETKGKIKEIINNLLKSEKYNLAIQIIFSIGLMFEEYVDINPEEYQVILSENYHSLSSLDFERKLYLKNHNLKQYYYYIKDLDLDNELAVHTLKIILNLIINGDNPFDYQDKIKDIVNHYKDNNLFVAFVPEINELFCKMFNTIIKTRINDLIEVIKLFDSTNPFMYNEVQRSIRYIRVRNLVNEQIRLNKIINDITSNNSISNKDKVFIYMNTHLKLLINLTEYIVKFISIPDRLTKVDVSDLFSDYYFYVRISKINKKNGRIKAKIINITENNKMRNSKFILERLIGHSINVGLILKAHISQYMPYDMSFLLDYIGISNNLSFSKKDYEDIYNNLINNTNISDETLDKLPTHNIINYNEINESHRIYDIYCKTINNASKNYKNLIRVLEKDYINPFRWPNSAEDAIETPDFLTTKKRVRNYFRVDRREEDYNVGLIRREESYKGFIELLESDASNDEIIKIYMNTFNRYNISVNDLLHFLITYNRIIPNEKGIVNLRELFKDYNIYGKPVKYDDETNEALINSHLLWTFRLIYKTKNYPALTQNHRYIKFQLDYCDTNSRNIYLCGIAQTKHIITSSNLNYLDKQLINMRKFGLPDEIENNIKQISPIELFEDKINITKDNKNQINNHVGHYILTMSKYLKDLNTITRLINALGDNNIFKYSDHFDLANIGSIRKMNGHSISHVQFRIGCQKEKDINKILYIYLNTYLRLDRKMDELLNSFCIENHLFNQEIDITDNTNIELLYSENEDKIILNYISYDKKNTNIVVLNDNLIKDKVYLGNLVKYHSGTNTLTFKIVNEKGE